MTPPTTSADQRTYRVDGMTCDHCVMSVREEVGELAGVTAIDIDLASGRLTVTGAGLDDGVIAAAVADAGYEAVTA